MKPAAASRPHCRARHPQRRPRRRHVAQYSAVCHRVLRNAQGRRPHRQHQSHLHPPRTPPPTRRFRRKSHHYVKRTWSAGSSRSASTRLSNTSSSPTCRTPSVGHSRAWWRKQLRAKGTTADVPIRSGRLSFQRLAQAVPGTAAPNRLRRGRRRPLPVLRRHHRHTQGRHAHPSQSGQQRLPDGRLVHYGTGARQRAFPRRPALLPCLRHDRRHAVRCGHRLRTHHVARPA